MSEEVIEVEEVEKEPQEPTKEAAPSMRESIEKAYSELEATEVSPEKETKTRTRDDSGKFTKKDSKPDLKPVSDHASGSGPDTPKEQEESIQPPQSWSFDERERFKQLPRETQKYIAEREGQRDKFLNQKASEYAQGARRYAEIDEAVAPYAEQWALQGISPGQGVRQLIAAQAYLEKNPIAGLQWLAQSLGVDPRQLGQAPPQIDPNLQALHGKISQLESQLTQREQVNQQAYLGSLEREVDAFAKEADAAGNPVRPYFQDIQEEMVPWVERLRAANPSWSAKEILNEAYEKATWANPKIRQVILGEMERKRLDEAKSKVESARKAGVSMNGAPNGTSMRPAPKTLREAIETSYDLLSSKQ